MISTLNIMLDELDCIKRIIDIKLTLIDFPGKIISTKEIDDIRLYFKEFERKIETYLRSFLVEKEKEAKSKKPKSIETKERFKETEALFEKVKTTEKQFLSKANFLFEEYFKKESEISTWQVVPRKVQVILNDGRTNNNNNSVSAEENANPAEPKKEEYLIIDHIFLNTKVTINDMDILKKRETLEEEKTFITQLFNLKELFENSQSKQYVMLDYYMNLYSLCIDNKFTLQQISTIMSIFFFIFSYSFSWVATEEKISEIFNAIISYHSLNNPPFTYQIFNERQKDLIINFFQNTFIKNFAFFEVLFRYDVSVCFFNQVITRTESNSIDTRTNRKENVTSPKNEESENMEEEAEKAKEKEGDRSLDDIEDEKEIERMKNFVNSFYQALGDLEAQKAKQEGNILMGKNMEEANQAKMFLDIKVPEIKKDINELIEVQTRSVIKPVEQELAEKAAAKGGKK